MWPKLLNMTRDECRLTLRRLELEAYSNMVSVLRAQGALEDNRKKLLEDLRAVLHISHDRHSAEARRVSNDQLLATIAEQLSGPHTGLGWICEGRRRVPLLPRGYPQTAYTEIADKAAELAIAENKELQKRLEETTLVAPKSTIEEVPKAEGQTAESAPSSNETDEDMYPPIAMEDQTNKLWDTELITRKRKVPEDGSTLEDGTTPVKNIRNIPVNTNQKHLNLSQIYSKFSQPASSKPSSQQSKHSYNQVSKVSTSKASQPRAPRAHKPRGKGTRGQKSQAKRKSQEVLLSPGKLYNASMQLDYQPNTFQASYAQAVLGSKSKSEFPDDFKPKMLTSPEMTSESPTMQLLTAPAAVPHEGGGEHTALPDDAPSIRAQSATPAKHLAPKPSQLVPKTRTPDAPVEKKPSEVKVSQKPIEGVKILSNRQVVVAPAQRVATSAPPKVSNTPGKLVTTKVIGSIPKGRPAGTPGSAEQKMIVVSKPPSESKNTPTGRLVVTSSASAAQRAAVSASNVARLTESLTPKGLPATDLKVSAKALVLNPKSGQKMVVLPAKARAKPGGDTDRQIPLIHFKGVPTAMKLVPVGSQAAPQPAKAAVAALAKSAPAAAPPAPKTSGPEPIKTANLADIVPAKGLAPVVTPKLTNPIVRPSSAKGNVIVVQKGTHIGKALTFAKNGSDMSKIIMGKNVTQLLRASKGERTEAERPGNVIVLELNDEQSGRPTTMSEILDRAPGAGRAPHITADTPVLFEAADAAPARPAPHAPRPRPEGARDAVTDWEMELDTVSRKDKDEDDKLNSLHLDLGMSSDSEAEYAAGERARPRRRPHAAGESGAFGGAGAMSVATRTLLSQLQDEGSSSDDSSFALRAKLADGKGEPRSECDDLTKAKEKLSEKVAEARSQRRRIDVYSTAITPADINLESFAYLDEGMMAGDDVFAEDKAREARRDHALHDQLARLLAEDSASADSSPPTDPQHK